MAPGMQRYTEPHRQYDTTTWDDFYYFRTDETTLSPSYNYGKGYGKQLPFPQGPGRGKQLPFPQGPGRGKQLPFPQGPGRGKQFPGHGRDDMPEEMALCLKKILEYQGNKIPYLPCTIA